MEYVNVYLFLPKYGIEYGLTIIKNTLYVKYVKYWKNVKDRKLKGKLIREIKKSLDESHTQTHENLTDMFWHSIEVFLNQNKCMWPHCKDGATWIRTWNSDRRKARERFLPKSGMWPGCWSS